MKPIKSANYIYGTAGEIKECIVTFLDGSNQLFKTSQELIEVQKQLGNQQKQFLVE
jgi:hypothetical protein